jgi:hypothetical protein
LNCAIHGILDICLHTREVASLIGVSTAFQASVAHTILSHMDNGAAKILNAVQINPSAVSTIFHHIHLLFVLFQVISPTNQADHCIRFHAD